MSKSYISSFSQRLSDAQPKKACLISSNAISGSLLVFRMDSLLDELGHRQRISWQSRRKSAVGSCSSILRYLFDISTLRLLKKNKAKMCTPLIGLIVDALLRFLHWPDLGIITQGFNWCFVRISCFMN